MSVAPYVPRSLGEPTIAGIGDIVEQARARRLVFYVGAGVSAAPPSNGPMGSAVADRLRPAIATMLGCQFADIEHDTLEELASKVAALGEEALSSLRSLAAETFNFAGIEPNYGHRAIAVLMREGLATAITVNWDCAIERAGLQVGADIKSVTSVMESQSLTTGMPLFKVHGTATNPATLKITREEVDAPQTWAVGLVHAALGSGTLVFAGLATVGDYVSNPIDDTLKDWAGYASSIRVVAPSLPPTWEDVLGTHADASHFSSYSNEFLDDLTRAILNDQLNRVLAKCHALAAMEAWANPMASGAAMFSAASKDVAGHLLFRWWRDGVIHTQSGQPFVTAIAGHQALMAINLLVGLDGQVEIKGRGRRFRVQSDSQYFEILARPGAHLTELEPIAHELAAQRWDDGAFEDARTITVIVCGAIGRFPASEAVLDIAGADDDDAHDIGGQMHGAVRLVSSEDAVQGRLVS